MTTGKTLFWTGFIITVVIIVAYLILLIIDVTLFVTWITSLSMCCLVLMGAVLMLIGRAIERKSGDDI